MSLYQRTLFLAGLLALVAGRAGATPDAVDGQWFNGDGEGKVAIAPCRDVPAQMCGAIVWLKAPNDSAGRPVRDIHNPDPALRNRPVVGVLVIRNMNPAGPGRWSGGKLYDPESGRSYNGRLRARPGGKLEVQGCVLVVCETQVWTRAD